MTARRKKLTYLIDRLSRARAREGSKTFAGSVSGSVSPGMSVCARIVPTRTRNTVKHEGPPERRPPLTLVTSSSSTTFDEHRDDPSSN